MSLPAAYRQGVGIMLLNALNHVFVAKRLDMRAEAWQMPQGGIDDGETPEAAMRRELCEETGITHAVLLAESRDWLTYDLPPELMPRFWSGKYRGQRQKWFCLRFTGEDRDINIATEHPEFSAWQWLPAAQLPDAIVPFKRDLYKQVLLEFGSHIGL